MGLSPSAPPPPGLIRRGTLGILYSGNIHGRCFSPKLAVLCIFVLRLFYFHQDGKGCYMYILYEIILHLIEKTTSTISPMRAGGKIGKIFS